MKKAFGSGIRHWPDSWSVGFLGEIYLLPRDVSFRRLRFKESDIPAMAKGWLEPMKGSSHYPKTTPTLIGSGNINTGCLVFGEDQVWTGIRFGKNGVYGDGEVWWEIPWNYVTTSGMVVEFTIVKQYATSDEIGTATIEKGGAGPFKKLATEPESEW